MLYNNYVDKMFCEKAVELIRELHRMGDGQLPAFNVSTNSSLVSYDINLVLIIIASKRRNFMTVGNVT